MKSVSYVGFFHKNQNDYRFKNSKTKFKLKKKKKRGGGVGFIDSIYVSLKAFCCVLHHGGILLSF